MATVNKNFRVKNGLVVEGSTATVNGQNILTETGSDNYIINLIGGTATSANTANTVVKRDGSGNFSAGTITATFSGNLTGNVTGTVSDISNHDTGDLAEGTNLYFTNQRALDATSAAYDAAGAASAAQTAAQNYADSLAVNYDAAGAASAAQTAAQNYADSLAVNYDAAGAASAAQTAAQNYADNLVNGLDTDDIEEGGSNLYFTNGRARNAVSVNNTGLTYDPSTGTFGVASDTFETYGAASTAEANAASYTDDAIDGLTTTDIEEGTNLYYTDGRVRAAVSAGNGLSYDSDTGAFSIDTTITADKTWVGEQISALVDGAPALLDTLNEIAAAINDDANFFTTISNNLATKLNLSGGTLTGALTLHADPVNALEAATKQYVDTAESDAVSSANSYTDAAILAGNSVAEPVYAAIDFNGVAKNVAATVSVPTASTVTAYEWNHTSYKSGKFTVKIANGTHTELSEILVTSDTSNNVHMTEYGVVGTNGSLATITADHDGTHFRIRVTTLNNNSTVTIAGTVIA